MLPVLLVGRRARRGQFQGPHVARYVTSQVCLSVCLHDSSSRHAVNDALN